MIFTENPLQNLNGVTNFSQENSKNNRKYSLFNQLLQNTVSLLMN